VTIGSSSWTKTRLHPATLVSILGCSAVVFILAVVIVYPDYRRMRTLDRQNTDLRRSVLEQQALLSAYSQVIAHGKWVAPSSITIPKRTPLLTDGIKDIPLVLRKMTQESGLSFVSASPRLTPARDGGDETLQVTIVARGDFVRFRELLLKMIGAPWFSRIDGIKLHSAGTQSEMSVTASVLLSR